MFNLFRKSTTKSIMPTVQIPTTPVIRSPFINNTNNNNNSSGGNTTTGNTVGNESSSSSISSTVNQSITNQTDNYITTNRFYVEMESTLTASFSECSGFGVNLKKESYLEGGVNEQQRLVVGHAEFDDVTLKKGMSNSQLFWEWMNNILNDKVKIRRNVNILLFNQEGSVIQCWTLIGAIPISWKCPGFQATGTEVAVEEMTLAYEGLYVQVGVNPGGASTVSRDSTSGYFPNA